MKKIISIIMAAMLSMTAFVGCGSSDSGSETASCSSKGETRQSSPETSGSSSETKSSGSILDVKMGMTYDEVAAILGEPTEKKKNKATWSFKTPAPFEGLEYDQYNEECYSYEVSFSDEKEDKDQAYLIKCRFAPCKADVWESIKLFLKDKLDIAQDIKHGEYVDTKAMNGSICFGDGNDEGGLLEGCNFKVRT